MSKKVAGLIVFALGFAAGAGFLFFWSNAPATNPGAKEVRLTGYHLTNPLLECELGKDIFSQNLLSFQGRLQKFVDAAVGGHNADRISVYYRDLNNGPSFTIYEEEKFFPASMMKLPLLIGYLKLADSDPSILEKKITYNVYLPQVDYHFKPERQIEKGKTYTVKELLEFMIAESDNNAGNLLHLALGDDAARKIFSDLFLDPPQLSDFLTVKQYASFYRVLFNASYLNKDASERALSLLTQTSFRNGLVAGVPPGTVVAHKFGELEAKNEGYNQLHDCGIVYYPNRPYLICVMSRGDDFTKLASILADVSRVVYENVDAQVKNMP